MVQALAAQEGLQLDLHVGEVETYPAAPGSFDAVTSSMSWGYFDKARLIPHLQSLLTPAGLLMISSTTWIDTASPIAQATHALLGEHHPDYTQHARGRQVELSPTWAQGVFSLRTWHRYVVEHHFSQASWRGRLRASKWVGAGMSTERAASFDAALADLLCRIAPAEFTIPHEVRIQIYERCDASQAPV